MSYKLRVGVFTCHSSPVARSWFNSDYHNATYRIVRMTMMAIAPMLNALSVRKIAISTPIDLGSSHLIQGIWTQVETNATQHQSEEEDCFETVATQFVWEHRCDTDAQACYSRDDGDVAPLQLSLDCVLVKLLCRYSLLAHQWDAEEENYQACEYVSHTQQEWNIWE